MKDTLKLFWTKRQEDWTKTINGNFDLLDLVGAVQNMTSYCSFNAGHLEKQTKTREKNKKQKKQKNKTKQRKKERKKTKSWTTKKIIQNQFTHIHKEKNISYSINKQEVKKKIFEKTKMNAIDVESYTIQGCL